MINNVVLVGRLTRDVDLRYTQGGTAVANFTVACDRTYRNANGERETDYISCVMWRKAAENFAKFTRKGSLVGIEGSIQTRNYENQQGQRVYVTEVMCNNFSLLEPKSVTENRPSSGINDFGGSQGFNSAPTHSDAFANYSQPASSPNSNFGDNMDPFGSANNNNPFPSQTEDRESIDIADDDLPF